MDIKQIILDQLLGSSAEDELANRNKLDNEQTSSTVNAALGAILRGLGQEVKTKEGAKELDDTIAKNHDGSVLEDLTQAVGSRDVQKDGAKILEHIFGSGTNDAIDKVAAKSGVSTSAAADIMTTLAPIVLGQLGKKKNTEGLDVGGLIDILFSQQSGKGRATGTSADALTSVLNKKNFGILMTLIGILRALTRKK